MAFRRSAHGFELAAAAALVVFTGLAWAQPPQAGAAPPSLPPLFFKEEWRQKTFPPNAAADLVLEGGVTPAAVTNATLELKIYDPNAGSVAAYRDKPPTRSRPGDWGGPSCIQLAGYNQNPPPPQKVAAGQPTDAPNLWTGVCQTPVAATLRHRTSYADLTGLARIRWVTRVSGFHVVRPVVKLADGTLLAGDLTFASVAALAMSEFPLGTIRWIKLDPERAVTVSSPGGKNNEIWFQNPDLSKVDEVGFVDLMPSSGHGTGGYSQLAQIEVFGKPVPR